MALGLCGWRIQSIQGIKGKVRESGTCASAPTDYQGRQRPTPCYQPPHPPYLIRMPSLPKFSFLFGIHPAYTPLSLVPLSALRLAGSLGQLDVSDRLTSNPEFTALNAQFIRSCVKHGTACLTTMYFHSAWSSENAAPRCRRTLYSTMTFQPWTSWTAEK